MLTPASGSRGHQADRRPIVGKDRHVRQFAREDDIPVPRLLLERDGLDLALDGAMDLDLDHPGVLDIELGSGQADAIAVGGELGLIEDGPCRGSPGLRPP